MCGYRQHFDKASTAVIDQLLVLPDLADDAKAGHPLHDLGSFGLINW